MRYFRAVQISTMFAMGVLMQTGCAIEGSDVKPKPSAPPAIQPRAIDLQGHRGMRAHWPENGVLGMLEAVASGVTTLEMDVVIGSDGQPLLSHEPWLNADICRTPDGQSIAKNDRSWNLYTMRPEDVARCDCGLQGHPRFPQQRKVPTTKPTLATLLTTLSHQAEVDSACQSVRFNIELKHRPEGDGLYHPDAVTFTQAVVEVLDQFGVTSRTTLQSFSPAVLEAIHAMRPDIQAAWLVEEKGSTSSWLAQLTFRPDILSPDHALLSPEDVAEAHARNVKVIPWTVNDELQAEALIRMGVDGIITDDPNRIRATIEQLGCTVD